MSATSRRSSRPQSSYGRRNSVERMPRRVQKIVNKNVATECEFNKHVKNTRQLRRIKSERRNQHQGDENLDEQDLTISLNERMMRLTVEGGDKLRRTRTRSDSTSPLRRSFEGDLRSLGETSPKVVRSGEHHFGGTSPTRKGSRAEISNAKLAMMKKRLEPLPSRNRVPSNEDLRYDYSP